MKELVFLIKTFPKMKKSGLAEGVSFWDQTYLRNVARSINFFQHVRATHCCAAVAAVH